MLKSNYINSAWGERSHVGYYEGNSDARSTQFVPMAASPFEQPQFIPHYYVPQQMFPFCQQYVTDGVNVMNPQGSVLYLVNNYPANNMSNLINSYGVDENGILYGINEAGEIVLLQAATVSNNTNGYTPNQNPTGFYMIGKEAVNGEGPIFENSKSSPGYVTYAGNNTSPMLDTGWYKDDQPSRTIEQYNESSGSTSPIVNGTYDAATSAGAWNLSDRTENVGSDGTYFFNEGVQVGYKSALHNEASLIVDEKFEDTTTLPAVRAPNNIQQDGNNAGSVNIFMPQPTKLTKQQGGAAGGNGRSAKGTSARTQVTSTHNHVSNYNGNNEGKFKSHEESLIAAEVINLEDKQSELLPQSSNDNDSSMPPSSTTDKCNTTAINPGMNKSQKEQATEGTHSQHRKHDIESAINQKDSKLFVPSPQNKFQNSNRLAKKGYGTINNSSYNFKPYSMKKRTGVHSTTRLTQSCEETILASRPEMASAVKNNANKNNSNVGNANAGMNRQKANILNDSSLDDLQKHSGQDLNSLPRQRHTFHSQGERLPNRLRASSFKVPSGTSSSQRANKVPPSLLEQFNKTKLCLHENQGKCLRGKDCPFAHGKAEIRQQPDLYKTKMCEIHKEGLCKLGNDCKYAHSQQELRSTPRFYKTSICVLFQSGSCSNKDHCRYAHGQSELRSVNMSRSCPEESVLPFGGTFV